jgi:putative RecB family exonuclease
MLDLAGYNNLKIENKPKAKELKKYSITADIISFKLCKRQYGMYNIRNFANTQQLQLWFGTLAHQVINILITEYKINNDLSLDKVNNIFFEQVDVFRKKGMIIDNEYNNSLIKYLLKIIQNFYIIEGHNFFKNVLNSELQLQADMGDYLLYGVIDIVTNDAEVWDFKASKFPDLSQKWGRDRLKIYEYQMYVYAELYKRNFGQYPKCCKLYFLNELMNEKAQNVEYIIEINDSNIIKKIKNAITNFSNTVEEIEYCEKNNSWATEQYPGDDICSICDFRWSCKEYKKYNNVELEGL